MWLTLLACRGPSGSPDRVHPAGVLEDCPPDPGVICPWAGAGGSGWNGDDVPRLEVLLSFPMGVATPSPGPGLRYAIADFNNHMVRAVEDTELQGLTTLIEAHRPSGAAFFPGGTLVASSDSRLVAWDPQGGGSGTFLGADRRGFAVDPDGAPIDFDQPADTVLMSNPASPEVDPTDPDLLYYVDQVSERVRRYDLATGLVDTVLGETEDASGDGLTGTPGFCGAGDALRTCLAFPTSWIAEPGAGLAVGPAGELYVADSGNGVIWRVADGGSEVLAGAPGVRAFADGALADARFAHPAGLAYDLGTDELFVADTDNHRIRVIDLRAGTVATVAGTGQPTCANPDPDVYTVLSCAAESDGGDGGPALEATLFRPFGVDLDLDGNLLIADTYDDRIRILYR
jgi:hypothetical protein